MASPTRGAQLVSRNIGHALQYHASRENLSEDDSRHLQRWRAEAKNELWEKLASRILKHEKQNIIGFPYNSIVYWALRFRSEAEALSKPAGIREQSRAEALEALQAERRRRELLSLAKDIKRVVSALSKHFPPERRAPPPPGYTGEVRSKPSVYDMERDFALEWLNARASDLEYRADDAPEEREHYFEPDWKTVPLRYSRQSGGAGKRAQSRAIGWFVSRTVNKMYELSGRPQWEAVALLTNIAFPSADLIGDQARQYCRPTTRRVRRKGRSPRAG